MNLDSLADIERRLERPWDEPVTVVKEGRQEMLTNCIAYLKYTSEGFTAGSDREMRRLKSIGADCKALRILKRAAPARRSYLDEFELDENAIAYLPPVLAFTVSDEDRSRARAAQFRGLSWKQFEPDTKVEIKPGGVAIVTSATGRTWLQIYARGDVNGNGIEDILLRADESAVQGTYANTRLFVLTRSTRVGKLQLLSEY